MVARKLFQASQSLPKMLRPYFLEEARRGSLAARSFPMKFLAEGVGGCGDPW
jgi:hypothetical protein